MQVKKILFPTDFSPASEAALDYAASLARDMGASLLLLHVAEPSPLYGDVPYNAVPEPDIDELRHKLATLPADERTHVERRVLTGRPAEEILDTAEKEHVNLIVMGTHGRTGLARLVMGSVAESVMRRSSCPVLTLKAGVTAVAGA